MMTHILSNLPEAYQNIKEALEYKLYNDENTLTNEKIRDKLLVKYDQMNNLKKKSREGEKYFYIKSQYKGNFTTCDKNGHKSKDRWHKKGA